MIDHLYISVAIFAIMLITGLVVVYSGMKLWRKLLVVALLSLSGIATYRAIFFFYGYPTIMQKSFKDALIVGFLVDKPNDVIHLWIKDSEAPPRSYTIPFSNKVSKALEKMRKKHRGKPFRVEIKTKTNQGGIYRDVVKDIVIRELPIFPPKR